MPRRASSKGPAHGSGGPGGGRPRTAADDAPPGAGEDDAVISDILLRVNDTLDKIRTHSVFKGIMEAFP